MTRTPDRFERMVEQFARREGYVSCSDILYREDVAKLLRHEHKAVCRLVKKLDAECDIGPKHKLGYRLALSRVLNALAKRAR